MVQKYMALNSLKVLRDIFLGINARSHLQPQKISTFTVIPPPYLIGPGPWCQKSVWNIYTWINKKKSYNLESHIYMFFQIKHIIKDLII